MRKVLQKNKGFTLIELLAIITILAVIMMITIPTVIDTIENSKYNSAKISMSEIEHQAQLYYSNGIKNGTFKNVVEFTCNGIKCLSSDSELKFKKNTPQSGKIIIDEDGNISFKNIILNNYYCQRSGESFECSKASNVDNSDNWLVVKNNKYDTLVDYKIYGNSIQNDTPSFDNAIDIGNVGDLITDTTDPNYGKYKISIKILGKNLFDVDDYITTFNKYKYAGYETKKVTFDGYDCIKVYGTLKVEGRNLKYLKGKFKPNTQYSFNIDIYDIGLNNNKGITGQIHYTDGTYEEFMGYLSSRKFETWQTIKVTTAANKSVDYINFSFGTGGAYSYIKNWQIEEGTTATDYEPYKELVENIYLDEPLRKVGDYTDYIDFSHGKIVRNIKEMALNGSESWVNTSITGSNYQGYGLANSLTGAKAIKAPVLCNKLPYSSTETALNTIRQTSGTYNLNVTISTDITPNKTYSEWQKYLSSNNMKVQYVLEKPIEQTISLPDISLFSGYNYVFVDTTISPSKVEFKYYK